MDDDVVMALCASVTGLQSLESHGAGMYMLCLPHSMGSFAGMKAWWYMVELVVTDADLALLH